MNTFAAVITTEQRSELMAQLDALLYETPEQGVASLGPAH